MLAISAALATACGSDRGSDGGTASGGDSTSTTAAEQAGSGTFGSLDGAADVAQFASPLGLSLTGAGELFIANGGDGTVRKLTF